MRNSPNGTQWLAHRFAAIAWALLATTAAAQTLEKTPSFAAGDRWQYREVDGYSRLPLRTWTREVISTNEFVRMSGMIGDVPEQWLLSETGTLLAGRVSNRVSGSWRPDLQLLSFPLYPGKRWKQYVVRTDAATGTVRPVTLRGKVLDWETVIVPAGEFLALKIERIFLLGDYETFRTETKRTEYEWYVPELKGAAKIEIWEEYFDANLPRIQRYLLRDRRFLELTTYRAGAQ